MEAFLIFLGVMATILIAFLMIIGMALWVYKVNNETCPHSYERVDTCNDKKMILVCHKCGKIKKLRK